MRVAVERNIMSCKSSEDSCYREGEFLDRSVRDVRRRSGSEVTNRGRLKVEKGPKVKRYKAKANAPSNHLRHGLSKDEAHHDMSNSSQQPTANSQQHSSESSLQNIPIMHHDATTPLRY